MSLRRDDEVVRTERQPGDPASIEAMARDPESPRVRRDWIRHAAAHGYSYNFTWLGVPIIQYPEDIVILQELLWRARPDLVIETGIARGGSLLLSASILRLLGGEREVLGIDVDIREHAKSTLSSHPLALAISTIEADSVAPETVAQVRQVAERHDRVLVILDSNHAGDHVAAELSVYGDFVTVGSYLAVMDTTIEDLPAESFANRPWGPGNSPATAVEAFLRSDERFERAGDVNNRLLASSAPGGYLVRIR
jgi:cephalosporin hydroxylase